jgi:hypothetical protein
MIRQYANAAKDDAAIPSTIEALAFLAATSKNRDLIVNQPDLMTTLYAAVPSATSTKWTSAMSFGLAVLTRQLGGFKPAANEQSEAMQRMRQLANGQALNKDSSTAMDVAESDEFVTARIEMLVKAGAVRALARITFFSGHDSDGIQSAIAESLRYIATVGSVRGVMVQQGAVRALLSIASVIPAYKPDDREAIPPFALDAAFALAKIAISLDPRLAFPNQTPYTLLRLFAAVLRHHESTLAHFETLLALTNIFSMPLSDLGQKVLTTSDLFRLLLHLQFDDHPRIQCAATEALCNIFSHPIIVDKMAERISQSGVIWVALCDAERTDTRMAASGGLALLCGQDARIATFVGGDDKRLTTVLKLLDPSASPDLQWRGVSILSALLSVPENRTRIMSVCRGISRRIVSFVKHPHPGLAEASRDLFALMQ